jgi:hypothetical protein
MLTESTILGYDRVRRLHRAISNIDPRNLAENCQSSSEIDVEVDNRSIREHLLPDPQLWHLPSILELCAAGRWHCGAGPDNEEGSDEWVQEIREWIL